MTASLQSLLADAKNLVSPPEVWIRLNEIVNDPGASTEDIAEVVMFDPALTAKLLQIVNSPLYHFKSRVDTISMAISIMGTNELFGLATAVTSVNVFAALSSSSFDIESFWKHSLACAIMARRIARESCVLHPERLYVAGLLHDIGYLVLYNARRSDEEQLLQAGVSEARINQAEIERFGHGHAEIGAELMKDWNLSDALVGAIAYNHHPAEAGDHVFDASIVHLADITACKTGFGFMSAEASEIDLIADEVAHEITGLSLATLDVLAENLVEDVSIAMSIFFPESDISISG